MDATGKGDFGESWEDNGFVFSFHDEDDDNCPHVRINVGPVFVNDEELPQKGIWIDSDMSNPDAPMILLSKNTWEALVKYVERKFNEPIRSLGN